jgi:hypothetical protein
MIMAWAPGFMGDMQEWRSADHVIQFLNQYFFLVTLLYVLPAWLVLRWLAAKVYARAVLIDVRRGRLDPDDLAEPERYVLRRLGLVKFDGLQIVADDSPTLTRSLGAAARLKWAVVFWGVLGFVSVLMWWAFFSQPVVAQFFNYRGPAGWINQPLIHVPMIRDVPPVETIEQALEVRDGM